MFEAEFKNRYFEPKTMKVSLLCILNIFSIDLKRRQDPYDDTEEPYDNNEASHSHDPTVDYQAPSAVQPAPKRTNKVEKDPISKESKDNRDELLIKDPVSSSNNKFESPKESVPQSANTRTGLSIKDLMHQTPKKKKKPPLKYSLSTIGRACEKIYIRRDIRSFTKAELDKFFRILQKINSGDYPNSYESFAILHAKIFDSIHQVAWTAFWHREFLWRMEIKLIEHGWEFGLPYWDWTTDSQRPNDSLIFTDQFLGGNGAKTTVTKKIVNKKNEQVWYSSDRCIVDGRLKNWLVRVPGVDDHCLKRNFGDGTGILSEYSDPISVEAKLSIKDYNDYIEEWESFPHGIVHDSIDEDMSSHYSPTDFIFFLHHNFLDRIIWEWQQRVNDFDKYPRDGFRYQGKGINGVQATRDDLLAALNVPVKDTFNTTNGRYCYTYHRWNPAAAKKLKRKVDKLHVEIKRRDYMAAELDGLEDYKDNCTIRAVKPLSRSFLARFKYDVHKHYLSISRGSYFIEQYNSLYCKK